jgi:hypothetical protein
MTRLEQLEKLLDLVDEASAIIRQFPEDDRLHVQRMELEGNSNGGYLYDEDDDGFYLRDHVYMAILKEKGLLPPDCDPATV